MNNSRIPQISNLPIPKNTKIAVITALWNKELTDQMRQECVKEISLNHLKCTQVEVAGSFELIAATKQALSKKFDAVIALGVVLNGETPHFEYVCQAVTSGLTSLAVEYGKPIGFGVLTCNNYQQAYDRAGFSDSKENKGKETAQAVLQSIFAHKSLSKK